MIYMEVISEISTSEDPPTQREDILLPVTLESYCLSSAESYKTRRDKYVRSK